MHVYLGLGRPCLDCPGLAWPITSYLGNILHLATFVQSYFLPCQLVALFDVVMCVDEYMLAIPQSPCFFSTMSLSSLTSMAEHVDILVVYFTMST